MLNLILGLITLFSLESVEVSSVKADVEKSTVVWTATKVIGGGHTGTIELSSANLEISGTKIKGGSFSVDMTTMNCTDLDGDMKGNLEGHLKSEDFFAVEKFKTADFKITKVSKGSNGTFDITGDVTIKGKTVQISFPATVVKSGDMTTTTAKITLDRTKFDVKYGSNSFFDNLGDKAISNEFTLDVTLVTK